jgi:hypothetical protein
MMSKTLAAVCFSILILPNAFAYTCVYQKDKTVVSIRHMEDKESQMHCTEQLMGRLNVPLVIDVDSLGGWVQAIPATVKEVFLLVSLSHYYSHTTPLVYVHGTCASACIGLLAGLNQMAGDKAIVLAVDPKTKLGFHAAGVNGVYEPVSNMAFLLYLVENGVDLNWLRANEKDLFSSVKVKEFTPENVIFNNSNILSFASIFHAREMVNQFPGLMAKSEGN